ncbi:uncharacterized protein LOC114312822 [Camellia sinensis]|uniref:uncharacterized protein LOC114312822 n=1 Tax=Camellia sinensis TaxID=4442 RepID=UPI0010367852|nr:uncharacterized protein LOC114312822 [Camellia sinensis]
MDKRKGLFWTPCAAHCIDLMLEDFEKEIQVHRVTIGKGKKIVAYIYSRTNLIHWMKEFTKDVELTRLAVTRFATSYLTLRRLHEQQGALFSLFTSNKWRNSRFAKSEKGKKIENIVLDNRYFWKGVSTCLKAAVALIKVVRLVDSDEHPAMGFIYEAMDRAKEEIQKNFNNIIRCYDPIWAIIDRRWETQLHHPLHAAAYFLNPQLHYSPNFQADAEIKIGLYKCLEKMVPDTNERVKIDLQIDAFKNARGLFGIQNAILTRKKKSPGDWWDSFGDECPELKRFAIRVLSLTCSSSGCERNWSAFEMVHSKRRNRLHQKRMNDLVFVMYNLKLRQRHKNRQSIMNPLCLDDVPSDDEWITEKENPTLPREGNWLHVLDRNARHGCHSEDEEADALARDLEQACRDHIGENVDEIHEVSDDDDMDDNMNAPRDFDDDFDDATIGDDDIEELGDTVGDDEDEGDNEIDNVVDCGNDDFGDEDDDLF